MKLSREDVIEYLRSQALQFNTAADALTEKTVTPARSRTRGSMSAAGRRRISEAQKRRWAKVKGTKLVTMRRRAA